MELKKVTTAIGAIGLEKALPTLVAVGELKRQVEQAQSDGSVSSDEFAQILAHGVSPLLKLHGVDLSLPGGDRASQVASEVSAAIEAFRALEAKPPGDLIF